MLFSKNKFFYSSQVVVKLLAIIQLVLIGNFYSKFDLGLITFFYINGFLLCALFDFGIKNIIIREVSQNNTNAPTVFGHSLSLHTIFCFIFSVFFIILKPMELPWSVMCIAWALFATIQSSCFAIYRGHGDFRFEARWQVISVAIYTLFILIAVLKNIDIYTLACSYAFIALVCMSIVIIITIRRYGVVFKKLRFWVIRGAIPFFAIAISQRLLNRTDTLMIERLLSYSDLATFYVAGAIINNFKFLPVVVVAPFFSRIIREKEHNLPIRRNISQLFLTLLVIVLISIVLISITGEPLIEYIFGIKYQASIPLMYFFMALVLPSFINIGLVSTLSAIGKVKFVVYILVFAVFLNMILNYYLIPAYQLPGAILATTISELLVMIILGWILIVSEKLYPARLINIKRKVFE